MNNGYAFTLESKPGKKKGRCPECGHDKVFTFYVDQVGNKIGDEYGYCDRLNNCGVNRKPELRKENGPPNLKPVPKEKQLTVDPKELLLIVNNRTSNFHQFCEKRLHITEEHLFNWKVGTKEDFTVFAYTTKESITVNLKSFLYDKDNCRKTGRPFYLSNSSEGKYFVCLFGEHLLSGKTICLVESEKTAVIASFFYPQFDFLATGSASGLTGDKIQVLFNKKIYVIVDADKAGRESSSINKLKEYQIDFHVIDLFPDRHDGYDLADAIIDGLRPDLALTEIVERAEDEQDLGFEMTFDYIRKHTEASIIFNTQNIINPGEIGVTVALPGSGKTSKVEILAAAFIASKNNLLIETGGIKVVTGIRKGLLVDTERPNDDNSLSFERIGRRVDIKSNSWLIENNRFKDLDHRIFTEISTLEKRKAALETLLSTDQYEFVLLDGVLDFSAGLNDEKASLEAVTWLRSLASKHDCTIWVTLHPNKGTENMAGHLGAFLYRFCRACLMIRPHKSDKRTKEITVDFPQGKLSHCDPSSFEPLYFKWDDNLKMMMPCSEPIEPDKAEYDLEVIQEIFRTQLIKGITKVPSAILKKEYGEKLGLKERGAKNHILQAANEGVLEPEGKGRSTKYILNEFNQ